MKKPSLLLSLFLCISVSVFTQGQFQNGNNRKWNLYEHKGESSTANGSQKLLPGHHAAEHVYKQSNIVSIVDLSAGPNAYGMSESLKQLWADDKLNAVAFIYRTGSGFPSGSIAYDLSVDGGQNWVLNNMLYVPEPGNPDARRPQGGIYNPAGNTSPANAYYTWFSTSSNQYVSGIHKLGSNDAAKVSFWSGAQTRGPVAFTINPSSGNVFAVASQASPSGFGYNDSLVIFRGVFNQSLEDYLYNQILLPLPAGIAEPVSPADIQIAFGPDGSTGYISLLFDNNLDPHATGSGYYPVLLKTTDGGNTWSEPFAVILGGPSGLPEIKNYLTDEQWNELWPEPGEMHRDSAIYQTAYDHGLAVDKFGNPHISVTIGLCGVHNGNAYSIVASGGYGATFHIYSLDQGQTFIAKYITHNKTFRGEWPGISEDNRSQISTTMDGSLVFLSWLDSDFPDVTDNIMPDIWCVGFSMSNEPYNYSEVFNVTYLSDGWLESFMGTASNYVLEGGVDYTIPFVFQAFDIEEPFNPVQYKYVADFVLNEADFIIGSWGIPFRGKSFSVSQNYPNPVNGATRFTIDLNRRSNVTVEVFNIMGQNVQSHNKGSLNSGAHIVELDMSGFAPGLYFYSVKTGDQVVTRKMVVR